MERKPYAIACYVAGAKVADTIIDLSKAAVTLSGKSIESNLVELSAYGLKGNAYWSYQGKSISTESKLLYNPEWYSTTPFLVVNSDNGCRDSFFDKNGDQGVSSFKIWQNTITPNGDGKNDYYDVEIKGYSYFSIVIADKDNKVVFSSTDPAVKWNGTDQVSKQPCAVGTYGVVIKYQLLNSKEKVQKYEKVYILK